ncbi:MAG: hypothetical protein VKL42_22855, partial [Snowella sp.]|nr:hypothetical protein [Snowella sp.]
MASKQPKKIDTLKHSDDSRKYLPSAEFQGAFEEEEKHPIQIAYERCNAKGDRDLQLVWRGKDITDWADLVVPVPPLYVQEKIHP